MITEGYAISGTTGELMERSEYNVSDFIEIKPLTNYSYYGFNVAYYDSDKRFIQQFIWITEVKRPLRHQC